MRFSSADREGLGQLVFDPESEPSYELMKACLVWPDERPGTISREGYELLGDLWIVRGYLHRNVPPENWGLEPRYFQEVWRNALVDIPQWPGFKRLELSESERAYLSRSIEESSRRDDY